MPATQGIDATQEMDPTASGSRRIKRRQPAPVPEPLKYMLALCFPGMVNLAAKWPGDVFPSLNPLWWWGWKK